MGGERGSGKRCLYEEKQSSNWNSFSWIQNLRVCIETLTIEIEGMVGERICHIYLRQKKWNEPCLNWWNTRWVEGCFADHLESNQVKTRRYALTEIDTNRCPKLLMLLCKRRALKATNCIDEKKKKFKQGMKSRQKLWQQALKRARESSHYRGVVAVWRWSLRGGTS